MPRTPLVVFALLVALASACRSPAPRDADDFDAVVYGGTAAGVVAAVQLAELGRRVVFLEPTERVGGMTTCGLGATDVGNADSVGGLARAFYARVAAHYARGMDERWTFEPHVALAILESMLATARVPVVFRARIADRDGAEVVDGRIRALRTSDGRSFQGRVFVDASYEGDLLARAGVAYRIGREANAEFGETLNGVQTANAQKHQFTHDVDPYRVPGDPSSGLLPGIEATPGGVDGDADRKVQAYCFRLCTTDVPANRLPWPKPAGYDERDYELLLRNFGAGDRRAPWHRVPMPNRKTDTNNNFAVSTDVIGLSRDWPEADWPARERLFAAHLRHTQGLLWTLANHARVPEQVRAEFTAWGPCKDEFVETGGWPPQLYVREARRMIGTTTMTERHCRGELVVDDPIGLGSYGMDSHNVQRHVDAQGHVRNEGDIQVHGFAPYGIAYGAISPRREDCANLLVPVAVSATHIAFGSIRMEPVFMVLAQSAAIAADLALERGDSFAVQDVSYPELRRRLLAAGQRIAPPSPAR
ncbi:MAG: FAD-dependent oxidoreductase [Planctomycetes bacterium]|nr:FAD-dependent oxidoreductase [Planctomycetota bacterium]